MSRASPPALNLTRATGGLLAINIVVHLARLAMSVEAEQQLLLGAGFLPSLFLVPGHGLMAPESALQWISPFSYGFLHGDALHLLVNMGFLLAFGTAVERRIGAGRFLIFYLLVGALAVIGTSLVFWLTLNPVLLIGASGAVAGLFGAAARFIFGRDRRRGLIMVAVFIGINLVFGLAGIANFGGLRGIAWEAHVAGLVLGYLCFPLFERSRPASRF